MRRAVAAVIAVIVFATPAARATTIQQSILADSAGLSGDEFGRAVAISGNRVVVGAPLKDDAAGAAFIYERLPGGGWTGIRVTADDRHPGDQFGYSVAIDGDRVVVGALFGDGVRVDSGSAYILEPAGNGFWNQLELAAPDGAPQDYYGVSVAVSGDRVVVGANWDDDRGPDSGSAYVHEWTGTEWATEKLLASDGATNDLFGRAVAVDGDTVVVGTIYDDGTATDQGSVYVFEANGSSWTESRLTPALPVRWGLFGDAVAVSAGRVVVGAPLMGNGAAFVFERSGSSWHEVQLTASDGTLDDQFGASVAISGNRIVVGAPNDGQVAQNAGAIYDYVLSDAHWFETKFVDTGGSAGDNYGASVGVHGDMAVAGVPLHDANGGDAGRVYVIEPGDDPAVVVEGAGVDGGSGAPAQTPSFGDIANSTFEAEIEWMLARGITDGCGGGNFCPKESVTRAQMATFLTRALGLELGAPNPFTDVGGTHAESAAAIAAAGISLGCGDGTTFCPYDPVTRAQMGSFFARALGLELQSGNQFLDVSGTHAEAINAIAKEGITLGCNPEGTRYCPASAITRGQMAAFLYRAFGN